MKPTKLNIVLKDLARQGKATEAVASGILGAVRRGRIRTVEAFDDAVRAAYEANGWHVSRGRPAAGDGLGNVPTTVRNYVWEVRSAFRAGLDVGRYRTFYALRQDRAELRRKAVEEAEAPPPDVPELAGVVVRNTTEPNGALIHDTVVTFLTLSPPDRTAFARDLQRLMHKYQLRTEGVRRKARRRIVRPPTARESARTVAALH